MLLTATGICSRKLIMKISDTTHGSKFSWAVLLSVCRHTIGIWNRQVRFFALLLLFYCLPSHLHVLSHLIHNPFGDFIYNSIYLKKIYNTKERHVYTDLYSNKFTPLISIYRNKCITQNEVFYSFNNY